MTQTLPSPEYPGGSAPHEVSAEGVETTRVVGGKERDIKWLCCKVRVIGELFALDDARGWRMNDFKGRHFEGEIVLWAVRW